MIEFTKNANLKPALLVAHPPDLLMIPRPLAAVVLLIGHSNGSRSV